MTEEPWDRRIQHVEAAAIASARRATVPELRWAAAPALLVAASECAAWLVFDGRAQWLGGHHQALLTPMQQVRGVISRGTELVAATEAYVRVFQTRRLQHDVDVRLAGLLAEPDSVVASRRMLEAA